MPKTFEAVIFEDRYFSGALKVPDSVAKTFHEQGIKRVVIQIKNHQPLHQALHVTRGTTLLVFGKNTMRELQLQPGVKVFINLSEDLTKYQMAVCEEFLEVLGTDPEGADLFHRLLPGKQRSLLHRINKIKSSQLRIEKALRLMDLLRTGEKDLKTLGKF
jgi:hypothetical protein